MNASKQILSTATYFLGYRERGNNEGFEDALFEKYMIGRGFESGMPWCSFFAELVYWSTYINRQKELDKLFSGSAVQTYHNFKKSDWVVSGVPVAGALAIWQLYRGGVKQWQGHIAVVEDFDLEKNQITTIDGNSNNDGSRNGYMVARVTRVINWEEENGLRLLGFIIPKEL